MAEIDVAARKYEVASARWARGHPDLDRAKVLIKTAYRQHKAGDEGSCRESIRRARLLMLPLTGG